MGVGGRGSQRLGRSRSEEKIFFHNQNENGRGWSEAGLGLGEAGLAQAQPGSGLVYSKISFGPAGLSRRSDSGSEKEYFSG